MNFDYIWGHTPWPCFLGRKKVSQNCRYTVICERVAYQLFVFSWPVTERLVTVGINYHERVKHKSRNDCKMYHSSMGWGEGAVVLKTLIVCNPFNMSHTSPWEYTNLQKSLFRELRLRNRPTFNVYLKSHPHPQSFDIINLVMKM